MRVRLGQPPSLPVTSLLRGWAEVVLRIPAGLPAEIPLAFQERALPSPGRSAGVGK